MSPRIIEDAAIATARRLLDSYPYQFFGSDRKLVAFNFFRHIKAGMEALVRLDNRDRRRVEPSEN